MSGWGERGILRSVAAQALAVWRTVSSGKSRRALAAAAWRWLAENPVQVAVSAALATAIYFDVHGRPTEEFVRPVAVKVRGVPENIRVGIDPPTVRVVFKGERNDMFGLDMAPPAIYVNYPGAQARKAGSSPSVKIRKRDVRLSGMRGFGSVSVVRFDPEKVKLVEDRIEKLPFDIEPPKLEGAPSSGLRAEVVAYEPKSAYVRGGASRLKGWEALGHRLQLAPVSVDGLGRGEWPRQAEILPPNGEDAMDVELPQDKVTVTVRVSPQREHMTLEDIPVRLSFPQGYFFPAAVEVEPRTAGVTLVGAKEQFREVSASNVVVYAEVPVDSPPLFATNAIKVPLVARVPQDKAIFDVKLTPPEVTLTAVGDETGKAGDGAESPEGPQENRETEGTETEGKGRETNEKDPAS